MLILARKTDEKIVISDDIVITIVEAEKDRVKIGIDAPNNVKIVRNELYDTERFNMQAAVNKPQADIIAKFMSDGGSGLKK